MTKALLITYSYPPNTSPAAQRPYSFKRYSEHDIIVITSTPLTIGESVDSKVIRTTDRQEGGGLRNIARNKDSWKYRLLLELRIPDKGILWYREAFKAAKKVLEEQDVSVIISTSPSVVSHILAKRLSSRYNLPWIADYRDFYYINAVQSKTFLFRKPIDRAIERRLIGAADMHIFISASMRAAYMSSYPILNNSNSTVIYNGYDESEFISLVSGKAKSGITRILYAGSFYGGMRPPQPLFAVLDYLVATNDSLAAENFEVLIAGPVDELTQSLIKDFKTAKNVTWLGPLPRKDTLQLMVDVDILWLITANHPDHYLGVPLKAYEYMGSGTPVLSFGPEQAEVKTILEKTSTGIHLPLSTDLEVVRESATRLSSFINQPPSTNEKELRNYKRSGQAQQLDSIIKDLVSR